MKIAYACVFIKNKETNMIQCFCPDLAICAEGETAQACYDNMVVLLKRFFGLAQKYQTDIPQPKPLAEIEDNWKGFKARLVEVTL